jgi:coenzyme F420 hydrogenase subunit beta
MPDDFAALVNEVVKPGLCCSCGACAAGCPQKQIVLDPPDRFPRQTRPADCKTCTDCYAACPGRYLAVSDLMRMVLNLKEDYDPRTGRKYKSHFGIFKEKFAGRATDPEISRRGASGGFVAALLSFLLEKKEVDAAVVTTRDPKEPWRQVPVVARSVADLKRAAGSRYVLVPVLRALSDLSDRDERCVFVGLPCHIQGLRKLQKLGVPAARKVTVAVGVFCGVSLSPRATEHIMRELLTGAALRQDFGELSRAVPDQGRGAAPKGPAPVADFTQVTAFTMHREGNCSARVTLKDGQELRYMEFDNYGFDITRLAPLYQVLRCSLCYDNVNEMADISVGDTQGNRWRNHSCVVARTDRGLDLVKRSAKEGFTTISTFKELMHTQNVFLKRRRAFTLQDWLREQKQPVVEYGFPSDVAAEYPWGSEDQKREFLAFRELRRTEAGLKFFSQIPRNQLAYYMGLSFVGYEWPKEKPKADESVGDK